MPDLLDRLITADLDTFREVVEGVPVMLWMGDASGKCVFLNQTQRHFWGVTLEEIPGFDWTGTIHPDDAEALSAPFLEAMAKREGFVLEARYMRHDGQYRLLQTRAQPRFSRNGKFLGMVGVNVDMTEQRQAEDRAHLLSRELAHRIKNIFTVVEGLISVSSRAHADARPALDTLRGRIHAMSAAYEVIRPAEDGGGAGTLHRLFNILFAPYQDGQQTRIRVTGTDLQLGAHTASTLALIFHELATNALKYGALSVPEGHVDVKAEIIDGACAIGWREQGGPKPDGESHGSGFGSLLIRSSIASLDGDFVAEWPADGLNWRLAFPEKMLAL